VVRSLSVWVVAAALAAAPAVADAATVTGTVFLDRDGDGIFSTGDTELAGARVAWGTTVFTSTSEVGRYQLTVPNGIAGLVWVSVPEGGTPGPVWAAVPATSAEVVADLAVRPLDPDLAAAPLTFVVAADSHMDGVDGLWTADDMAAALGEALAGDPRPRFFTVVGDITQANRPEDFAAVDRAFDELSAPWVPVPGNHDWYDGGVAYRAKWGPEAYSFASGGVHFVVWNQAAPAAEIIDFIRRDLETVDPARTVIGFGHVPPDDALAAAMRAEGVDYLFTGHWHTNRVVDHDGMLEFNTEPFVMGGIDLSPAGYRIVTVDDAGLRVDHHTYVDEPVLHVVWPPGNRCVDRGTDLLVAAEVGSAAREVTARVDGADAALEPAGGWLWRGRADGLAEGEHRLDVAIDDGAGPMIERVASFHVCPVGAGMPGLATLGDWPQQQDGPEHTGAVELTPQLPYAPLWAAASGGHLHQSAPIAADGRVFVTATDFGRGDAGGIVALDLASGAELWRFRTATPVRNSVAVDGGVVVLGAGDGAVIALDAATGEVRWTVDLGDGVDATQSALWAAPAIRDGVVYVGIQRKLAAIELATGEVQWTADPAPEVMWLGSFAAVAVTDELVIGSFNRSSGLWAWDRADGAMRWRVTTEAVKAINGAPVIAGDTVLVGNVWGEALALDLASGDERWVTPLVDSGHDWAYAVAANPAYADGRFFVPTQWGEFRAVDATTGDILWSRAARPGTIRTAHYRGVQAGFQSSPVVMGDIVWVADTSGLLLALDVDDGDERGRIDLGLPVVGGLSVAGELLLVPTWDGAVHAFAPAAIVPGASTDSGGCCSTGRPRTGDGLLACLVAAGLWRRRRVRAGRSRSAFPTA